MENAVELAKQSDSTIIVLLVVLVLVVIALIPVMKTLASINSARRKQDLEREAQLIKVIEKNTEVNTALKTLIESNQKYCYECKAEQAELFRRLFDNQDTTNTKLVELVAILNKAKGAV